jgi:XXXCH domain-containing protein
LEQYEEAAREEVIAWKDSWKAVKKRLARSFKMIQKTVAGGKMPDADALAEFVSQSREMAKFAEPEWQAAMDEYIDHLGTLKQAVEQNQYEIGWHNAIVISNKIGFRCRVSGVRMRRTDT